MIRVSRILGEAFVLGLLVVRSTLDARLARHRIRIDRLRRLARTDGQARRRLTRLVAKERADRELAKRFLTLLREEYRPILRSRR